MKNILVPTDFSACANHAMELGFAFAEFFDAKLHFFTVLNLPKNWEELSKEEQGELPELQQQITNADVLLQDWKKRAKREGVNFESKISSGKFIQQLQDYVAQSQADFVVMGSHGTSGKQEFFIGSNTQKAVRKLTVPVFVIKNPLKEYAFRNVVFASNFDAQEKDGFLQFLNFIKWFTPEKIHLLLVKTSGWFAQPTLLIKESLKDFKALCKDFDCETHYRRDLSVDGGIRHFAEDINADLIVISNHHRSPMRRIFQGSNVEALVNHSSTPVLSLDYQEEVVEG